MKKSELKRLIREEIKHLKENRFGIDHDQVLTILDAAAMYTSTAHEAADVMWNSVEELVSYLKSDHIPKKHHKDFDRMIKKYI